VNNIKIRLSEVGGIMDLTLESDNHVSLSTAPYSQGHTVSITCYDVDTTQVLEALQGLIKEQVAT